MTHHARRVIPTAVAVLALAAALTGCSSPSRAVNIGGSTGPSAALDAKVVLAKLAAANIGVTKGAVQDENSDPNNLIGRPGQYTSRASFDLLGGDTAAKVGAVDRGGVVEVFPDAAAAKARAGYIQGLLKANPVLGAEYDYLTGAVLVRVSGKVKPSTAAKVQAVVAQLG